MINDINLKSNYIYKSTLVQPKKDEKKEMKCGNYSYNPISFNSNFKAVNSINTTLTPQEQEKYLYLTNFLSDVPISPKANGLSCSKQLDLLLKQGKLLSKSIHDNSTTLDNLYEIATTKRADNLNPKTLISNVLDDISNYNIETQKFGDIPQEEKRQILSMTKDKNILQDPNSINVEHSGVCPSASATVNALHRYPADFARLVNQLSSSEKCATLNVNLSSISPNLLEAAQILRLFEADVQKFSYNKVQIKAKPDENAYIRANIQQNHYDMGERNVADVLVQSMFMQLGSQNTYNSLTDTRAGFNSNPKGLVEFEKTFIETLLKNKEITSLVYQIVDENQNLVGYTCSFDKIQKHLIDTLNSGEDVIIGYVDTNETAGVTKEKGYSAQLDGAPNKIINGHEITIVDYRLDNNGKAIFKCVDTDDDTDDFVEYNADWLLPKIHHAGYPATIVKNDEKEIMEKAQNVA